MGKGHKNTRLHGIGSLMTSGMINQGLGALRLLFFAPLLGMAGFGALRLASTASAIFSSVAGLGLYTCYMRYLPEVKDPEAAAIFIRKTYFWSIVPSLLIAAIFMIFRNEFAMFLFFDKSYLFLGFLVCISVPITVIYKSYLGVAMGRGRFKDSAVGEAIQNLIYFIMGLAILLFVVKDASLVFGSFLIGMGASIIWLMIFSPKIILTKKKDKVADELFKRALKFSLWFALIPLFQYLFDFIDRWMLARYYNLETTGAYSLIPILTGGMFVLGRAMMPVVARKGAELKSNKSHQTSQAFVWGGMAITMLGSMIYAFLLRIAEPLVWIILGKNWSKASSILPLFLSYSIFYNMFNILGCFAALEEKTWVHVIALIAGAGSNIVFNWLLIRPYGITGAAIGTLIGLLVSMSAHLVFIHLSGIVIPFRSWFIMLLTFAPILPDAIFYAIFVMILIFAIKGSLILKDSDRRMLAVWYATIIRKMKSSAA